MVSFQDFALVDGVPIYQQILAYLKRGAAAGSIRDGDELPSRRVLSALLGVNPNTVQKAYRQLEEEGLVRSHAGARSFMSLDAGKIARVRAQLVEAQARRAAASLKALGLSRAEALALIDSYWE